MTLLFGTLWRTGDHHDLLEIGTEGNSLHDKLDVAQRKMGPGRGGP